MEPGRGLGGAALPVTLGKVSLEIVLLPPVNAGSCAGIRTRTAAREHRHCRQANRPAW